MRKVLGLGLLTVFALLSASPTLAAPTWDRNPKGFVHGIALEIEGEIWYFAGPGSLVPPFSVIDVPGHTWVQTGPYRVKGRHYNIGPAGMASWWATGEPNKVLLFVVDGIIDVFPENLSPKREQWLMTHGYVHVHELVRNFLSIDPATGEPMWEFEHPTYASTLNIPLFVHSTLMEDPCQAWHIG